ncbi:putative UDP-rhamnose:rhamnosyltransferase 1 [Cicer arietinum]|uniref:Glycosyltransferase n=1 Tax=Cicer arietinum TaxID=3827 RepID=A0A1S2XGP1_CICAR|nr:putative UDP-rhamnose:rhamnosyltransferase 1 [Cicer arietinum]
MEDQPTKLHIAVFPYLAFGHITPAFHLSKLLAQKGHRISFISTPRNIKRLPKLPTNLQTSLEIIELKLPHVDNLPDHAEATMDIPTHIVPYLKKALDGLKEPLTKFLETSTPDCIIYDFGPYWLPPILSKLGIFHIYVSIYSGFGSYFFANLFVTKSGERHFDESKTKAVALKPFEEKYLGDKHLEKNESGVSDAFRFQQTLFGADLLLVRSCMEIEGESLTLLENLYKKPVIPIGLLPSSLDFSEDKSNDDDNWCKIRKWLDTHEKNSVIYVAFGSEAFISDEDFTEIALGLELSGFPFLFVIKNKNSDDNRHDWFKNRLNNGLVWTNWVPQLRILAHESVGGFLTHCGWSSVIESVQVGCPLIMLPLANEQGLIARLMEEKMVGVKVARNDHDGKFNRDSVAKALRSVMDKEEGKVYRSKVEEMSKIFGDMELQDKYIDDFVDSVKFHMHASKH